MRKAKRGPALFEVLGEGADESSDHLKVPSWWAGQDRGSSRRAIKLASSPPEKPAEPRPLPDAETTENGERPPVISFSDGCLRLSLTSTYAGVAVFAALLVVLLAYELGSRSAFSDGVIAGRASYVADATSEIEQARLQKPATHIVASLLQGGAEGSDDAENSKTRGTAAEIKLSWIQGHTYIVAQEFRAGREEDSRRAQAFLASEGVDTALVPMASGSVQLITTRGFNHGDSTQKQTAIQSLQNEHRIGEKYFARGGGYRLQGYFKKLTGDRW